MLSFTFQGQFRLSILISKREGPTLQAKLGAFIDESLDKVIDASGAGSMGALPALTDFQGFLVGIISGPIFVTALETDLWGCEGKDDTVKLGVIEAILLDDKTFAWKLVLVVNLQLNCKDY